MTLFDVRLNICGKERLLYITRIDSLTNEKTNYGNSRSWQTKLTQQAHLLNESQDYKHTHVDIINVEQVNQ